MVLLWREFGNLVVHQNDISRLIIFLIIMTYGHDDVLMLERKISNERECC